MDRKGPEYGKEAIQANLDLRTKLFKNVCVNGGIISTRGRMYRNVPGMTRPRTVAGEILIDVTPELISTLWFEENEGKKTYHIDSKNKRDKRPAQIRKGLEHAYRSAYEELFIEPPFREISPSDLADKTMAKVSNELGRGLQNPEPTQPPPAAPK